MNAADFAIAIGAVSAAAAVCAKVQHALVTADTLDKKDKSPVTVADFAAQAVVCRTLAQHLPGDRVVGEEAADALRGDDHAALRASVAQHAGMREAEALDAIDRGGFDPVTEPGSQRYWTLDPIDGTKGFLRGEQYAVALALIEDGHVVLGVLGCPNLESGRLVAAVKGHGTRYASWSSSQRPQSDAAFDHWGTPTRVSTRADAAQLRICESVESGHTRQGSAARVSEQLGVTAPPLRMDSQCKYAALALGMAEVYLRLPSKPGYVERIWDHAAGMLCVTEAGGTVTDVSGTPLDFTHGPLHQRIVGAVAATRGEDR